MVKEEQIKEVVDKIAKEYKPEKIILFGSYAWGHPTEDSDVDLFVVQKTENARELAQEMDGLIFPRNFPLDIIVYDPLNVKKREEMGDFFITDILTKGKLLHGK